MPNPLACRYTCAHLVLFVLIFSPVLSGAQNQVYPPKKSEAPRVLKDFLVISDKVIQEQWPASLDLVNAPADLKQVEPGECIRFGAIATGDNRDELLKSVKLTFEFNTAGKVQVFTAEPSQVVKQIKPEGGDFVTQALGVAGIKNPIQSLASLAVSPAKWCAPADIQDAAATVKGAVILRDGNRVSLDTRKIGVKTFEAARKQPAFTDMKALGAWVQGYHRAPDPAQLLPGLRLVAADEVVKSRYNIMWFFIAALKANPVAANDVIRKLPTEQPSTRLYAIPILRHAGYQVESLLDGFKDADNAMRQSIQIPDPFDITPDHVLPDKMDMLWGTFFATGRIEPIRTISSMLAWRNDYEKFMKLQESGQRPKELTDSIMRGVAYAAAGWSLNSLSLNDGLVSDYLEAIKAAPETSKEIKAELSALSTNPAFKQK